MNYRERITRLMEQVPSTLVDLAAERQPSRIPTQASSEFTTNREQGDWAEKILLDAINQTAQRHVAVRYGMSDSRVAGEEGFRAFFEAFQQELDEIGKRPDLLIFRREDLPADWGTDISQRPRTELDAVVGKAVAGLEVRSSAFLSKRYDDAMRTRTQHYTARALELVAHLTTEYADILAIPSRQPYADLLAGVTSENIKIMDFKRPVWRSSPRLVEAAQAFSELKTALTELRKRDFLSITPKVEDLRVVYQWVQMYNVPHYYVQVFFDQAYILSYEHILTLLTDPDNEDSRFFTEADVKNQQKTTIKINPQEGNVLAADIAEPTHASRRKELQRGRLLYYVTFTDGAAHLDPTALAELLHVAPDDL